tara:strand:+ start:463 stop:1044 length:582 start_codon:yes stop_codon:yes gene_type:complete
MKKILAVLVLSLFLTTSSQADDIRDLEIDGMSVGDSALKYYTKKELNNALEKFYYKDKEFMYYFLSGSKLGEYDAMQITVKPNDKNYIMYNIDGHINYDGKIEECHIRMDEAKKDFDSVVSLKPSSDKGSHPMDRTGDSKYSRISYVFKKGDMAEIICYDMSKKYEEERKYDRFAVTLGLKEFKNFLTNKEYN